MNRCTALICFFSMVIISVSVALPYWIYRSEVPGKHPHYLQHFGLWTTCEGINTTECKSFDTSIGGNAEFIAVRQLEMMALLGGMIALIANVLASCLTMTGPAFNIFGSILCLVTVLLLVSGNALFIIVMYQEDQLENLHAGFGLNVSGMLGFVWSGVRLFCARKRE